MIATSQGAALPGRLQAAAASAATNASRVELVGERTENTKVFLNPDGSRTAEVHAGDIHYRDASGAWQDIDDSLVQDASGWRNRAGDTTIHFARRSDARDVISLTRDGRSVGFGYAGSNSTNLAVRGHRAVYPSALPGVDLQFDVIGDALKEQLILKRRPASAPSWLLPMDLTGLTAEAEPTGEISLLDATGARVFFIAPMSMVDSSVDPRSGDPAYSDDVAMSLVVSGGNQFLKVVPSMGWLSDPSRKYPVLIDPTVSRDASVDTFVQSGTTSSQSASTVLKAGTFDSGTTKARSLFKFNNIASDFAGTQILSATFSVYENWSYSCSARTVDLYRVTENWSSSAVYTNQPANGSTPLDTVNAAKGYSSSCPAGNLNFDVTSAVANWVSGAWPNYGFKLRATSETDSFGWKKFASVETSHDPVLSITYNTPPTLPTARTPADGTRSNDASPTLRATYQDPDSGDAGYVNFQILQGNTVVRSGRGPTSTTVNPNTSTTWTPSALTAEGTYQWRAQSCDGRTCSGWTSSWTYVYDHTAPPLPTINSGPANPSNTTSPTWTFSGQAGSSFQCALTSGATTVYAYAGCTSPKSFSLVGKPDGDYTFQVKQTDSAGNTSSAATSTYTSDRQAPTSPAFLSQPPDPSNNAQPGWTFSGESGATFICTLSVGASVVVPATPCPGSFTSDLSSSSDGLVSLAVSQTDSAGNASTASTSSFTLDRQPPDLPQLTATPDTGTALSATWSFTTDVGATAECEFDTAEGFVIDDRKPCTSPITYDLTGQPDGNYDLAVYAVDPAGNSSEGEGSEYLLDRPCATPSIASTPVDGTQTVGSEVDVQATVTDTCNGYWAAGVAVDYSVSGTSSSTGTLTSDEDGNVYVALVGTTAGTDQVTFTAHGSSTSTQQSVSWSGSISSAAPQTTCDLVPLAANGTLLPTSCDTETAVADPVADLVAATSGPCADAYMDPDTGVCMHGADGTDVPRPAAVSDPAGLTTPSSPDADSEVGYSESTDADYLASVAPESDLQTATDSAELASSSTEDALCKGDGTSGYRVQAVYVIGKDRSSRYLKIRNTLRTYAHRANTTFYRSSNPNYRRKIRFVCNSASQISVLKLVVPASIDQDMAAIFNWLRTNSNAPANMRRKDRKYMMWVDRVTNSSYCGLGEAASDNRKAPPNRNAAEWGYYPAYPDGYQTPAYGATWLVGCAGYPQSNPDFFVGNSEAHELTHNLGGVNPAAPHASAGFHCWDEHDDMCYDDTSPTNDNIVKTKSGTHAIVVMSACQNRSPYENRLDCRHDDYFNSRRHLTGYLSRRWNVADSRFLLGPR